MMNADVLTEVLRRKREQLSDAVAAPQPSALVRNFSVRMAGGKVGEKKTAGTALRELAERPSQALPYIGGLSDATLLARVYKLGRAVEAGEALAPEDEEFMRGFIQDSQRPQSIGYMATKIAAQLPATLVEFFTSGGAAAAGKGAAQAGARRLMGTAMREAAERAARTETLRDAALAAGRSELAEKLAVRLAAARAATPFAARAAQTAAGAVGSVAGRVAQFGAVDAMLGGGRISAIAYARAMPELGLEENERGELAIAVYGSGREFLDALPEAVLDQFIEVGSEMSGGALAKLPLIDRARTAAAQVAASWIARNNPAGSKVGAFLKVLDRAGWQGPVAEYLEERIGDTARAATGIGEWEDIWPGLDQTAAELIAFSVPGAVVGAAEGARQRIERGRPAPRAAGARFREEAAAAKPTGTEELEDADEGVAQWARASGVRGARQVAPENRTDEEQDAADLARALGMDLRIVDGDNIGEAKSRGALLGRGFAVMARGTATPEAVVFHEVAHVARRRSPGDWDALRQRLVEAAPEFVQRAEQAWEQAYRGSIGQRQGQDPNDPDFRSAMAFAVGDRARFDEQIDADLRTEEGVSTAAEWLAPVLSYGVTAEGRADLKRVLETQPRLLTRVKEAIVDVIARLVGARGAQTRRASVQRLRDVLADSEASDLGVERAARMALDILETVQGIEARRGPGSRMGFEQQGPEARGDRPQEGSPSPARGGAPAAGGQSRKAAEKAERRARQRQWKAIRETESRARAAEEAAQLGLGPDERMVAIDTDIEQVLIAARDRRRLAEAAQRTEAQRAAQAAERAQRPKQRKPRGERTVRVVEDRDDDVDDGDLPGTTADVPPRPPAPPAAPRGDLRAARARRRAADAARDAEGAALMGLGPDETVAQSPFGPRPTPPTPAARIERLLDPAPLAAAELDPPASSAQAVRGDATEIELPDGRALPAQYVAVEADDLIPSHDARRRFQKNAEGDANERPYDDPTEGRASRETVEKIARRPKPRLIYTDTPTALDGPPIVRPGGVVLGGNARSMGIQLAYHEGGEAAAAYRAAAIEFGARVGIDAAQLEGMTAPVIVREIPEARAGKRGELSRVLNQGLTTARSALTDAVSRGAKIDGAAAENLVAALGAGTLADAWGSPDAVRSLMRALVQVGAFDQADLDRMLTPQGLLTPTGKDTVEQTLLGAVVPDVRVLAETAPALRNKLMRGLPGTVRARAAWSPLGQHLMHAVQALNAARQSRLSASEVFDQMTFTPEPWQVDQLAREIAVALDDAGPVVWGKKMRMMAQLLREQQSGQAGLFAGTVPTTPVEAVRESLSTVETEGMMFAPRELKARSADFEAYLAGLRRDRDAARAAVRQAADDGRALLVDRRVGTADGKLYESAVFVSPHVGVERFARPWRVTRFGRVDRAQWMPEGHTLHRDREEAIARAAESVRNDSPREQMLFAPALPRTARSLRGDEAFELGDEVGWEVAGPERPLRQFVAGTPGGDAAEAAWSMGLVRARQVVGRMSGPYADEMRVVLDQFSVMDNVAPLVDDGDGDGDMGMWFAPALPPATRAKVSAATLAMRQMFQDRTIRLRDLMDQNGIASGTAEDADLHGALDLAISRAGAAQEALTERVLKMLAPFRGRDLAEVQRVAAAHSAPQRNAWMMSERGVRNASGVSDAEARQIEADARGKLGSARVDRLLDELRAVNREHLDLMVEAQVLTREAADKWHAREPHYLSLRDMADELEGDLRGFQPAGRSAQVRGPLFRKAEGRFELAGDALLAWHTSKLAQIDAAHRNKALAEQGVALAGEFAGQEDPPVRLVRKSEHVGPKEPEGGLAFFLGGERAWLVFADQQIADALKGLDAKQVGWALGALGKVTRTFSRGVTARNPFFWPRNFLRDTLGAAFNVAAGEGRTAADAARVVGAAWRDLPQIIRHTLGRRTAMAARIERAQRAGYKTTWAQRDAKDLQAAMQDALAEKKTPGQRARAFLRALDRMSDAFEQATRLAAFEYELERTGSEAKAALYAKRITVNFDMRGDATSALSTVFAFFNPAVQGATRLLEAIRAPQGAKLASGIVAVGLLSEVLGFALSDDDEATGLPDFAGVSEFERSRSLVAPFEVAGARPKLLLPYGLGAIFAAGRRMAHLASHMAGSPLDPGYTANQAAFDTVGQLVREWMPIDTTGGVAGIATPTIASPFIDIQFNTSFTGQPLMPQASSFGRTLPDSARYFSTLEDTFSGIVAKGIADVLNLGGSEKLPTGLDVSPESVQRVLAEIMSYVGLGLSEADRASQFVLSKRPATVVWTPLLRDLVTESTDYFVSERFYELRDRGSQMRSAAADGPEGAREARAMDPALWKVLDGLERAHKSTGDLRRKIREADTRAERRELRARLTAVQARALRRYYAALES